MFNVALKILFYGTLSAFSFSFHHFIFNSFIVRVPVATVLYKSTFEIELMRTCILCMGCMIWYSPNILLPFFIMILAAHGCVGTQRIKVVSHGILLTWLSDSRIGCLNSIQVTTSRQGGVVSDPLYVK
jgi:hypothetical protein